MNKASEIAVQITFATAAGVGITALALDGEARPGTLVEPTPDATPVPAIVPSLNAQFTSVAEKVIDEASTSPDHFSGKPRFLTGFEAAVGRLGTRSFAAQTPTELQVGREVQMLDVTQSGEPHTAFNLSFYTLTDGGLNMYCQQAPGTSSMTSLEVVDGQVSVNGIVQADADATQVITRGLQSYDQLLTGSVTDPAICEL